MIPFIIAGAIGYGIAKLLEEDTKKYAGGGMTNEDILRSFLTSERETQTNNLATFYSTLGSVMLLRNYGTLIAKRNGRRVEITNVKYSKTTSGITNRLKALAEQMGYNVSYVSEFSEGGKTGANDIGEDLENYSNYDEFYNVVFDYIKREENLTEEETKDICNVNESIIEAEFDGGSSPRFTGDVVLGYLSNERAYKKFAKGGKTGEKSTKKKTIKKLTKNREPKMVRQYFDDSPYSYAGGGEAGEYSEEVEKILENLEPEGVKFEGNSREGFSVLVKDKNSDFSAFVDVYMQGSDVTSEWNQYIFAKNNSKDMLQSDLQDNVDIFDYFTSEAIQYLQQQGAIKQDDKGDWSYTEKYAEGGKAGKYSIIVWETEEDRDAGESFVAEILTNKQEALEKAEKMYYKQDFSAIEVIDENDEVILHLSSNEEEDEEDEEEYSDGGSVDMNKHIWEGWTIGAFIDELEPQFNMINSGRSWQKPFKTKDEVKKWAMDNQPYYKKYIPEVVDYFWAKSQNKNNYKNGGGIKKTKKSAIKLYYHQTSGGAEYLSSSKVKGTKDEGSMDSKYIVRIDGAKDFGGELVIEEKEVKLYYHQTSGGAEYLSSRKVKGTKDEGSMDSEYIVRIDGAKDFGGELVIEEEEEEYARGGGIKNYTKKELELFDGIFESYFNEKIDEKKILRFRNKLVTMNIGKDNPALDFVISVIDSIVDGELVPAKVQAPYEMTAFEIKAGEMGEELIKINPSYGKGKYANSFAGKDVTLNFAIKLIFSITDGKWVENKNKLASGGEAGIIHLISDNATPQIEINIIEDDILRESKNFFNWKNVSVKRITSLGSTDYDKFIEFLYKKGYGKDKYAEGVEGGEAGDVEGGEAGDVEKRYGVYNYDTKNVEGYFDDLIEAEEFASQFKNVSVYEKEYLVEAIITETDYDGEYVREIPISVNIFAKDKNSAMDKADDNIREQNPQWEDFEIDIVSVEILKPFFSSKGYMVFNYTDDIYATDEVFKTKKLANDFIKEFISKFAKQGYYRDNQMNKIDVEDIDLLVIPSDFNPFGLF